MLKIKIWRLAFYDQDSFIESLKQQTNVQNSLSFSKEYLLLALSLFAGIFIISNWQALEASFAENEATLRQIPRTMYVGQNRDQGIGDYFEKVTLDANDVKSILALLKDNPKFHLNNLSGTTTEIAKDDHYRLKAYFTLTPKNFFEKELESLSCEKSLISQGQVTFITSFQVKGGTTGRINTLTLTVEDIMRSPLQMPRNGKITLTSTPIYYEEKEGKKEENEEQQSPLISHRKTRSFSFSRLKNTLSGKLSSPKNSKEERKNEEDLSNFHKDISLLPPLPERHRAQTEVSFHPQKSALSHSPKREKVKKLVKSLSFSKDHNKQKMMCSPMPTRNRKNRADTSTPEFRRSKSYSNLRTDHSILPESPVNIQPKPKPLPPRRSVKEMIREIEKKSNS